MADTNPSSKVEASRSIYYSLTDDVPELTEEEKLKLEAVMKKAQEFEAEEESKMRQPVEGQLYKYTNVMKGWQYRWFVLTPDTGLLEYYMLDERKKSRPRGALHLAGAVVTPSEEDNQSFSVSAVCGEVFKLKATDAKDRQFWVDKIRSVVEKCLSDEPIVTLKAVSQASISPPGFNFCKSSTFHVTEEKFQASPSHATSEKNISILIDKPPTKPVNSLHEIKDAVYKAVACQKTLTKSIENLPFSGPSLKCSDRRLLLIKATSQATVQSLEQCFFILRKLKQREVVHPTTSAVASDIQEKSKSNVSTSAEKDEGKKYLCE